MEKEHSQQREKIKSGEVCALFFFEKGETGYTRSVDLGGLSFRSRSRARRREEKFVTLRAIRAISIYNQEKYLMLILFFNKFTRKKWFSLLSFTPLAHSRSFEQFLSFFWFNFHTLTIHTHGQEK